MDKAIAYTALTGEPTPRLTAGAAERVHLGQQAARGTRVQLLGVELDEPGYIKSRVLVVVSDGHKMCATEVEGTALQQLIDGTVWEGDSVKIAALRRATTTTTSGDGATTVISSFADPKHVREVVGDPRSMVEAAITDPIQVLRDARMEGAQLYKTLSWYLARQIGCPPLRHHAAKTRTVHGADGVAGAARHRQYQDICRVCGNRWRGSDAHARASDRESSVVRYGSWAFRASHGLQLPRHQT